MSGRPVQIRQLDARIYLKVPFAEKDEAKETGAHWDPARKAWFITLRHDREAFFRWDDGADAAAPPERGDWGDTGVTRVKRGCFFCARCASGVYVGEEPGGLCHGCASA